MRAELVGKQSNVAFGLLGGIRGSEPGGQVRGLREGEGPSWSKELGYERIE